jgi:7-cyano-7-deazaguanine tRNA-ribosyltransferase
MKTQDLFELKATDLGGRIGCLRTKSSDLETPALLPVIHPIRQLVPCKEIRSMGYEAVMTNAYTTFKKSRDRANEGIHKIIDFNGTVMTDSGGYQVLEFGSVDILPEEMARFEEKIGSDIAIILDKPTGLEVTRRFASLTVKETLSAAERTREIITGDDIIWTLPIQGGKYLDLVSKSAKFSANLDYGCYALGSPVEVMEQYDFALLIRMIVTSKKFLPQKRPFHLFGAGHPLILPLAIALGCDMFDSASYMLYAKEDRYISLTGTIRLDHLEYLPCSCKVCTSVTCKEMKSLPKDERVISLAKHNLAILKQVIDETKQAIWEGRLWEHVQSACRNHPRSFEALLLAVAASEKSSSVFEMGTPAFKERGLFNFEKIDLSRPELRRYREKVRLIDLSKRKILLIVPETRTKPFLKSKIFEELRNILSQHIDSVLVTFLCPNFGLVPAELSDVYPLSQFTSAYQEFPAIDPILANKTWGIIFALIAEGRKSEAEWLRSELASYLRLPREKLNLSAEKVIVSSKRTVTKVSLAHSYRDLKQKVRKVISQV